MVSVYFNKEDIEYIVLRPGSPESWRSHFCFLFLLSFLTLLPAVIFTLLGAWLILPFAGIEVIALLGFSYYVTCKRYCQEVIHVTGQCVSVQAGRRYPQHKWSCHRHYCQIHIRNFNRQWYNDKIMLCCSNSEVEIGSFLNCVERRDLIRQLRVVFDHV